MKTPLHRSHDEATINSFRKDPQFAAEYLNAILEDGDQQELLTALRYLAAAFGGIPYLAEQAELNATTLYRTLSPHGNPELKSLLALLKALGLRLAVQPLKPTALPSGPYVHQPERGGLPPRYRQGLRASQKPSEVPLAAFFMEPW